MKKIILAAVIVVVCIAGVFFFRNYFGMGFSFMRSSKQGADLMIANDSSDGISVAFKENGKEVDKLLKSGESATGGKGFIRVYTAKKQGSYELTYPYPLPAGSPEKVTLSQIMSSAQKENIGGDGLYEKDGMIGDIKVHYEEIIMR